MNWKITLLAVGVSAILAGCTSQAGPFVTNISSDGHGNLIVEKCMMELQRQINTVENSNCNDTTISLGIKSH
jgi:hypothetical protein